MWSKPKCNEKSCKHYHGIIIDYKSCKVTQEPFCDKKENQKCPEIMLKKKNSRKS